MRLAALSANPTYSFDWGAVPKKKSFTILFCSTAIMLFNPLVN
jgi:hypothetical protein